MLSHLGVGPLLAAPINSDMVDMVRNQQRDSDGSPKGDESLEGEERDAGSNNEENQQAGECTENQEKEDEGSWEASRQEASNFLNECTADSPDATDNAYLDASDALAEAHDNLVYASAILMLTMMVDGEVMEKYVFVACF